MNMAKTRLKFLFLEPFFGGSHQDFAEGLISHTSHHIEILTMPARFWKWRMRGAAFYFANKVASLDGYDGLIVTDLMSLSDFKALYPAPCTPSLVYFHENQLTYPLAPGETMDFQFGFTNISTALAADRILFNSLTHFDAFFSALPGFLKMMPEFQPKWVTGQIRDKSDVLCPGCRFPSRNEYSANPLSPKDTPPLIIWNHRWEFDKNPKAFFDALDAIVDMGLDFRLALLGENFQAVPKEFVAAKKRLKKHIVQYGYVESRKSYIRWLRQGHIVVSTADQENFGISVVEAIRYGCLPLLPNRLSYPEIIPSQFHENVLYRNRDELIAKLKRLILNLPKQKAGLEKLSKEMGRYAWGKRIHLYDEALKKLCAMGPNL